MSSGLGVRRLNKRSILQFTLPPVRSWRGAVATKQSQSEIATPVGLAMTTSCDSECKLFQALGNK
jgi:hypothetical protein